MMKKISEIDTNFKTTDKIDKPGIRWINAKNELFTLHGLLTDDDGYKRMDSEVAAKVNEGVMLLHRHTSGGRLTFETDSPYIAISVKMKNMERSSTMPMTSYCGFDLFYIRDDGPEFAYVFAPKADCEGGYESIYPANEKGMNRYLIHFPLYTEVDELYIGLDENATINKYTPYDADQKPIVYYGSSITQGGCATRSGNSYPAIVAQKTNRDFLCLGFSGSAHGEQEMADYIASLPMSAFVLDYDHNDCTQRDRLSERHPAVYKTVRQAHPDIPIIIMSAPYAAKNWFYGGPGKSFEIVHNTYLEAKERGENVYFINGGELFGEYGDCALVDQVHPNDYGMIKMADAVIKTLKNIK